MPSDKGVGGLSFSGPIPKAVRNFGQILDPNNLKAGDLILVAPKHPNWVQKQITSYQAEMFPDEHAKWAHAAVSGGRYEICEATVAGVKAHEYWEYMTGEYELSIRRLIDAPAEDRALLAYYAATTVKTKYNFRNIIDIARSMKKGDDWNKRVSRSKGVICSQLYAEAAMRAGYFLGNTRSQLVCPAHLSISPILQEVPPCWIAI